MAQDIQQFYTQVQAQDFARQFQFRVTQLANTNFTEDQFVYLETANLPGRAITNVQVPFMGLQFNVPGTATYPGSDSWAVSFRCDQSYNIRAVLEAATFLTFDDTDSEGNYNIARNSSVIELELLGKKMEVIRKYKLFGAYIVSVGDIAYNLGDSGSIVTVPATLAYQYWRVATNNIQTTGTGRYTDAFTDVDSDGSQVPVVS
jgi:hypothetical protein